MDFLPANKTPIDVFGSEENAVVVLKAGSGCPLKIARLRAMERGVTTRWDCLCSTSNSVVRRVVNGMRQYRLSSHANSGRGRPAGRSSGKRVCPILVTSGFFKATADVDPLIRTAPLWHCF